MPMSSAVILDHLQAVERERGVRRDTSGLVAKVAGLKAFQQRRFAHTYSDLLRSDRYAPAARFFLAELYGPSDFTQRDAQFMRVVPALVRLFPSEIVETVATLAQLHALSEGLDTAMAIQLQTENIDRVEYVRAWVSAGQRAERFEQIALTLDVASRLDGLTRKVLMRNSLRLMRGPARAAGLTELQGFLEAGFDAFRAMGGAREFIATVEARESALASTLFDVTPGRTATDPAVLRAAAALP